MQEADFLGSIEAKHIQKYSGVGVNVDLICC